MTSPPSRDTNPEERLAREAFISREDYERDLELARAMSELGEQKRTLESMRVKVKEHEKMLQQGKGLMLAGRVIYVVIGVCVSAIVWFFARLVEMRPPTAEAPKAVATQAAHAGPGEFIMLPGLQSRMPDASIVFVKDASP